MSEPILTQELKLLLDYIKGTLLKEFPIHNITTNFLLLAILDNQNCEAYNVLSKLMMATSISEFKGFVANLVLEDTQKEINNNTDSNNSNEIKFDDNYDFYAENIAKYGKTVTSSLMLTEIVFADANIKNKLNQLGVTHEQLYDVVIAYSNKEPKDEIKPGRKAKTKQHKQKEQKSEESDIIGFRIIPEESNSVEANCENLVRNASKGMYDDIIGFDDVVDDIFDVLGKYDRNTVAIIGPNGVGKTSVVYKMAKRLYEQNCPKAFRNKYVMQLNETINSVIISDMNRIGKYIAFIDNLEKLFINKDAEMNNSYVLTELFKCPNVSTIVCLSETAYAKSVETKPELAKYIHKIKIEEPKNQELIDIISNGCKKIEEYNSVAFNQESIKESIRLAKKFITIEKSPKSALNILDFAGSHIRMNAKDTNELTALKNRLTTIQLEMKAIPNSGSSDEFDRKDQLIREEISIKNEIEKIENNDSDVKIDVNINDVRYAVSKMTGVPVTEMDEDEKKKLKSLYDNLTAKVIGQDDAVNDICKAVKRQRVGLSNPNKPCCMLFVGSTGTGKSFLAKRLAYEMFGDEKNMVRLDMSEYSDKTSVTKLYGASAGYVGYEEGGILTEAVKKKSRCVLLLDEIEKAHTDVYNVFLQVFDEGRLTDNKGVTVDFKNVIIIMTSNVGAREVADKQSHIGFGKINEEDENKEIIIKSIKKQFKPEFINRIDNICYFNKLTDENLKTIIKNEIKNVHDKILDLGYDFDESILNGPLVDNIFDKVKEESEYGARPILREIQKQLEDKLTDYIIDNNVEKGFFFKYDNIY